MESNSVFNHTLSSGVWLQTELDSTKSHCQLIIKKNTICEKRSIPKLWKKEKICIKRLTKELVFLWWSKPRLWLVDLSYNFECDWFMKTKILNVICLLNCPITNCPITTWASELTQNVSFSNHSLSRKL